VRHLSIKLYRIYVCYTNITLYIQVYIAFGLIHGFTQRRWVFERITCGYGGPPVHEQCLPDHDDGVYKIQTTERRFNPL